MSDLPPLPYGRQSLDDDDLAAVAEVLRSHFLTQGPAVPRFEQALAARCHAAHGVAVANGTAALHLGALALGLGPGDWLWTSPITFVASANCARYCGAQVDFVDIDPDTANLCPRRLAEKLETAEKHGRLPKVIVPVHFAGQSCAMDEIHALAQRYGIRLMEDAAHALGGSYHDEPVGSAHWADVVTHSFHPVKIITTGEGGAVTTNDPALAEKIARLRTHGITRDATRMELEYEGDWHYEQLELGYNYRMTDLQAALGVSQLQKLEPFANRRRELAALYDQELAHLPVEPLARDPRSTSGWHLYVIRLQLEALRVSRREVFDRLRAEGILVNVHYIPVHLQPDYRKLGFHPGQFPEAEAYYARCLTLPLFPRMTDDDVRRVRVALEQALAA